MDHKKWFVLTLDHDATAVVFAEKGRKNTKKEKERRGTKAREKERADCTKISWKKSTTGGLQIKASVFCSSFVL